MLGPAVADISKCQQLDVAARGKHGDWWSAVDAKSGSLPTHAVCRSDNQDAVPARKTQFHLRNELTGIVREKDHNSTPAAEGHSRYLLQGTGQYGPHCGIGISAQADFAEPARNVDDPRWCNLRREQRRPDPLLPVLERATGSPSQKVREISSRDYGRSPP